MTDQRHIVDNHVADYYAPEPSVPETHDSFELTEDTLIIYGQDTSQQWIWTVSAVQCAENR